MYESLQIPPQATIISIEKRAPKFHIMEEPRNHRLNHRISTLSNALSKTSNPAIQICKLLQRPPQATKISEKEAPKLHMMAEPRIGHINHWTSTFSKLVSKLSNPVQIKFAKYSSYLHRTPNWTRQIASK